MASVLSELTTSTATTTARISSPVGFGTIQIRPVGIRIRETPFSSHALVEEPGQTHLRFNRLMSNTLLGESSSELRGVELGQAATRNLMDSGISQGREKRRKLMHTTPAIDVDLTKDEGWDSIQDYGKFLGDTADTFQMDSYMSSPTRKAIPTSPGSDRGLHETQQAGWLSWRNIRFGSDFAHLAPLTSRENRTYARQSSKLIDWLSDPGNDWLFYAWNGLDQAIYPQVMPDEAQQRRETVEWEALETILQDSNEQANETQTLCSGELGWRPADPRGQSSFAKYLSQEAPQLPRPRLDDHVTRTEPSWSSNMGGSRDTRSVVSQDNHWRKTIFG